MIVLNSIKITANFGRIEDGAIVENFPVEMQASTLSDDTVAQLRVAINQIKEKIEEELKANQEVEKPKVTRRKTKNNDKQTV